MQSDQDRPTDLCVGVSEGPTTPFFLVRHDIQPRLRETEARASLPHLPLPRGRFYLWVAVLDERGRDLLTWHPATHFDVVGPDLDAAPPAVVRVAPLHVEAQFELEHRR